MGALHPCLNPWCQACGAQTHVCRLKWTLVLAPPLLTEDLEPGLLTLGPDRMHACPDPGHRHAGDINVHSAHGETRGVVGTGRTRNPVTPALERGPGPEQLRPRVQAGPGQRRTALGAPRAPHLQTHLCGVGLTETVGVAGRPMSVSDLPGDPGPRLLPGCAGPGAPCRPRSSSSPLWEASLTKPGLPPEVGGIHPASAWGTALHYDPSRESLQMPGLGEQPR